MNARRVSKALIAHELAGGRSIALRIAKKGKRKGSYKYAESSSPLRYKESNIAAFKRKKRGE